MKKDYSSMEAIKISFSLNEQVTAACRIMANAGNTNLVVVDSSGSTELCKDSTSGPAKYITDWGTTPVCLASEANQYA